MFLAQCIEYVLSCLYLFNELFFRERFSHPGIFGRDERMVHYLTLLLVIHLKSCFWADITMILPIVVILSLILCSLGKNGITVSFL